MTRTESLKTIIKMKTLITVITKNTNEQKEEIFILKCK